MGSNIMVSGIPFKRCLVSGTGVQKGPILLTHTHTHTHRQTHTLVSALSRNPPAAHPLRCSSPRETCWCCTKCPHGSPNVSPRKDMDLLGLGSVSPNPSCPKGKKNAIPEPEVKKYPTNLNLAELTFPQNELVKICSETHYCTMAPV